jgi:hypothetical protein
MKEKESLKDIQDSIKNEAIGEKVAEIVNKNKKKLSSKEINKIIVSENLRYEAIRGKVTEMVMGKKEANTSESLKNAGFNVIEETKYFGSDPK